MFQFWPARLRLKKTCTLCVDADAKRCGARRCSGPDIIQTAIDCLSFGPFSSWFGK